jgi:hypothetical protein
LGVSTPIDPGKHVIEVTAPGKKPWRTEISVDPNGDSKSVTVPALEDAPQQPSASPEAAPPAEQVSAAPVVEDDSQRTRRMIGFIAGGVGIASIGVGAFFGVRALGLKSDSDKHCDGDACDAKGLSSYKDAQSSALIADVLYGVGVVGLGVGTYLVLTNGGFSGAPKEQSVRNSGLHVEAIVGPRLQGAVVRTTW